MSQSQHRFKYPKVALKRTLEILRKTGWCQGKFTDHNTGEHCLVGALNEAHATYQTREASLGRLATAIKLLHPRTPVHSNSLDVIAWNDRKGRTWRQVSGVIRKAIRLTPREIRQVGVIGA